MQTRCPHCKTLFEIQEIQLRAASGQARCSCCDNIFNARKHLTRIDTVDGPAGDIGQPENSGGALSLNGLFQEQEPDEDALPECNTDMLSADAYRNKKKQPVNERQMKAEPESEKPFSHSAKSKSDIESANLQDRQSFADIMERRAFALTAPEQLASEPAEEAPPPTQRQQIADSEGIADQRFDAESIFQPGQTNKKRQGRHPVLWSIAILCLLATALVQIVWFMRGNLKPYPEVRELLEFVCTQAGCELPPWHEPERFIIASRSVRTHPKNSNVLQIQLVFTNTARFAQFYPQLQLKLYNTSEKLSAQRVFRPEEYLAEPQHKAALIKPAQSAEVDMALADPGVSVTGFKIEFL